MSLIPCTLTLTLTLKCTKFDSMTRDMRIAMFRPMCDEALLGVELKHHPNIISIRYVRPDGEEFLVMMDLVSESSELQDAYEKDLLWHNIDGGRSHWITPPRVQITSVMAMLWYQVFFSLSLSLRLASPETEIETVSSPEPTRT